MILGLPYIFYGEAQAFDVLFVKTIIYFVCLAAVICGYTIMPKLKQKTAGCVLQRSV